MDPEHHRRWLIRGRRQAQPAVHALPVGGRRAQLDQLAGQLRDRAPARPASAAAAARRADRGAPDAAARRWSSAARRGRCRPAPGTGWSTPRRRRWCARRTRSPGRRQAPPPRPCRSPLTYSVAESADHTHSVGYRSPSSARTGSPAATGTISRPSSIGRSNAPSRSCSRATSVPSGEITGLLYCEPSSAISTVRLPPATSMTDTAYGHLPCGRRGRQLVATVLPSALIEYPASSSSVVASGARSRIWAAVSEQQQPWRFVAEFVIPVPDRHPGVQDRADLAVLAGAAALGVVGVAGVGQPAAGEHDFARSASDDRSAEPAGAPGEQVRLPRRRQAPERAVVRVVARPSHVRPRRHE